MIKSVKRLYNEKKYYKTASFYMILFQYPNIQYMYSIGVVNMNDTTPLDISPYIVELLPS